MKVAMIAALASNRVIGNNNQLPWHLPNDLKYFRANTLSKPVIMGRKTFESIGKPLPGRCNIVLTRSADFKPEGVKIVHSLDEALAVAESVARIDGAEELMVIGGEQLYKECLPLARHLYLTRVHAVVSGDAYFPEFDETQWKLEAAEHYQACGTNPYDYSFEVLSRCV